MRIRHSAWMAIAAAAISGAAWLHPGLGHDTDTDTVAQSHAQPAAAAGDIATLLGRVRVVDQIPHVAGYQRGCGKDEACTFGPAWNDPLDASGCDSRNRLLRNYLQNITFKPGTHDCKVTGGVLDPDPYTGQRIMFSGNGIQADHIYPLARAYSAGASQWVQRQRQIFANDFDELIPVSGPANRAKSDSGLEWLPTYQPCTYIQRYLAVAVKYQLPITVAEQKTATATCPATQAPAA
jgi:hypothetical protein